jgi:predicted DNA-binding transcriptional regulator AlpA
MQNHDQPKNDELLDVHEARAFVGRVSRSTFRRGVLSGRFSKPLELAPQIRRWRRSELAADLERIAAERDA